MATIQIADKPTLDSVLDELLSSEYGLEALQALLNTVNTNAESAKTYAGNVNTRLTAARAGYLDYLANGTYGLSAIRTLLNTANTNAANASTYAKNVNDRLTAARAGYLDYLANGTYGLNAIKTAINNISASASGGNPFPPATRGALATTWNYSGYTTVSSAYGYNYKHTFTPSVATLSVTGAGKLRIYNWNPDYVCNSKMSVTIDDGAIIAPMVLSNSNSDYVITANIIRNQEYSFGSSIKVTTSYAPNSVVTQTTSTTQPAAPSNVVWLQFMLYLV